MAANDHGAQGAQVRAAVLPAVIIGVGGTGAEVLLRVRRRFFDESRSLALDEWPIVQFLYLDTDLADKQVAKYNQHLFQFQAYEFFPTVIDDYRVYTHHLHTFPTLKEWWCPDQVDLTSPMLSTGAGQIRAYGRLAFWHHAAKIRQAIAEAVNRAASPTSRNTMAGRVPVDNNAVAIYVVGSVAGGTGSGMMMDLGFLLRNMGNTRWEVNAYMVLPGAFQDQAARVRANGYAALKELEYYCSRRVDAPGFDDRWADNNPTAPITRTTPFNRVFLFDSENDGGQNLAALDARAGLVEMIAESIHCDFGLGGFAQGKRSTYVNQDSYLVSDFSWTHTDPVTNKRVLTEVWAKAYQAMGLSKLYIPVSRIQKACAALLWSRVLHMFASGTRAGDTVAVRDGLLRSGGLHMLIGQRQVEGVVRDVNDFTAYLQRGSQTGNTLQTECVKRIRGIIADVRQGAHKKDGTSRHEHLTRRFHMLYEELFVQPNEDKNQYQAWGFVPRLVEGNRLGYLEVIERQLDVAADSMASDPTKGIGYACDVLSSVHDYLEAESLGQVHKFVARHEALANEIAAAAAEFQATLIALRNHEEWSPLSAPLLKDITIDHDVRRLGKAAERWYQAITDQKVALAAVEVCRAVVEAIGEKGGQRPRGLMQRLALLEVDLERLSQTLGVWSKQFAALENDPLNLCVYEPDEIEPRYMPQGLGLTRDQWANPAAVEKECRTAAANLLSTMSFTLLDGRQIKLNVSDIPNVSQLLTADVFCRDLLRQTLPVFDRLRAINVIDVFVEKHPRPEVQVQLMSNLVARAKPWFRKDPAFVEPGEGPKVDTMVGCVLDENNPTHTQWWQLVSTQTLTAEWGVQKPKPTDAPWTVLFMSQYAGFPLCYGASIRDLRNHYQASVREGRERLHNSRKEWRYPDLLILQDSQWQDLRRASEAFVIGLALGVIKQRALGAGSTDGAQASFYYQYERNFEQRDVQLGTKSTAINRLVADPEAYQVISDRIEKKRLLMRSDPEYRERVRALLNTYISPGGPFAPGQWDASKKAGAGGGDSPGLMLEIQSIEYQVVDSFFPKDDEPNSEAEAAVLRAAYEKAKAELPTYTVERSPGWRVMNDAS